MWKKITLHFCTNHAEVAIRASSFNGVAFVHGSQVKKLNEKLLFMNPQFTDFSPHVCLTVIYKGKKVKKVSFLRFMHFRDTEMELQVVL